MKVSILRILLVLSLSIFSISSNAQEGNKDFALAQQYFNLGEYEKAEELYSKLWNQDPKNQNYYRSLFRTLVKLDDYKELEKVVKKQVKKNPGQLNYLVDLGYVYQQSNQAEKGEETFNEAIEKLPPDDFQIRVLANTFSAYREIEYMIKTYQKGNELLENPQYYNFDLGYAYMQNGDMEQAVDYLISYVEYQPKGLQRVQTLFQNSNAKETLYKNLEAKLYAKIQQKPNEDLYPEFLTWLFLQRDDFESALIQVKALDKRNKEEGYRVLDIARMAKEIGQYEVAIDAYTYLLGKGDRTVIFITAKQELLQTRKQRIEESFDYTQEDLIALRNDYTDFIDFYGKNESTAGAIRELAQLQAFYLYNLDTALIYLEELIEMPTLQQSFKNEVKIDLGDLYVAMGEIWEATLLYAQADKSEKDSPLGEMARFKNAKLSYYKGEFEWAQAQLNILKASTTELIANDALELSIFILENTGLDTSFGAMKIYSRADLLVYQNRLDSAIFVLDSIGYLYPGHVLTDNVLMTKADIALKRKDFELASSFYQEIIDYYPDGLLGDNALFNLAELKQFYLNDEEGAQELYKQLIFNYQGSILLVEARKRFRELRGDEIGEELN